MAGKSSLPRPWSICALLLLAVASCHAETCPWLNAATAAGALGVGAGSTVTASATHTSPEDDTCQFKLERKNEVATLEIAVHTMTSPAQEFPGFRNTCSTEKTQLRGIGNEAIECSTTNRQSNQQSNEQSTQLSVMTEIIVARVRDRAFVLKWTYPAASDSIPVVPRDELQDKIRNLAEQIAGSLF